MIHLDRRNFLGGLAAAGASVALAPGMAHAQAPGPGRIDVHHHFASPYWLRIMDLIASSTPIGMWKAWSPQHSLESMDVGGTQKAVLSMTVPQINYSSNEQARALSRDANEFAAKLRSDYPGRFGFFGALPFPDVDGSLAEIAYALDVLKSDGIGMFTSYGKSYLGDDVFNPVFEELNRRRAIVFVHPTSPSCCTNVIPSLYDADIEYGTDTTRAIARMVFSGSTIRYPNIRFIWSHAGGTMPYLQGRFERESDTPQSKKANLPHAFIGEARKMYYDIAQAASTAPMAAITKIIPTSQLLFGSDYPYLTVKENAEGLEKCGVFKPRDLAAIGRGNAVALFGS